MAEELKQLAESGLNRVLIISSVLNYRRSLAIDYMSSSLTE
jgi:hypothetical protein